VTSVLIVDDEPQIRRALDVGLRSHGYLVRQAADGASALEALADGGTDVVILDLGLPDMDGTEVLRRLRAWSDVAVVVLSVRAGQADKIAALDAGADDYVEKPFGIGELLARIRALRRRLGGDPAPPVLRMGELEVDRARTLVTHNGEPVHLTPTEYRLLEAMATNPGKLLTHAWLLRRVWGAGYDRESGYLRVYVRQLRRKLADDPTDPRWIGTEPGVGYRWLAEPRRNEPGPQGPDEDAGEDAGIVIDSS
jgi:two-component system, OmpR family, KDP operon response regulator KdpE